MAQQTISPKSPRSINSKKVFFAFSPGESSFQRGYLGAHPDVFLTGVLHIRYTNKKPIFAKKVEVSFVGKESVFFIGTLEEGQKIKEDDDDFSDDEVSTETLSTHTAKRTIFSSSICLWRSQSKGSYESVTGLDLPFRFKLPENLPPSLYMDKGCGRIYYMLKATISRRPIDPDSRNYEKKIKIFCPIVRYTVTPPQIPSRWLVKQEGPALPHAVDYDVSLSHSTFGSGSSIVVPIKLKFHEPQIYLKNIFIGIKEYHELRTNRYETITKRYIVEETVNAESIPTSGSDNEYSLNVKLSIPSTRNLVYSVDSTYITVSHKIKVKFHLGKTPNINLSKFINIQNVVSRKEYSRESLKVETPAIIQQKLPFKEDNIKRGSYNISKRLSPFLPMFSKIHIIDKKNQKQISMQLLHLTDSETNSVYNSRSLISK
ncbi:13832_t:CDS:1 [Dentiscutata erythropus]|uniref:13832_t:CDS:1 n=1 Tax=Dentiscutata erythropus TaxID=1348616 RepID=A0A9N9HMN1_9GLOM|nr:13832_t:CDS:1 [Dentiscutata erythropus]